MKKYYQLLTSINFPVIYPSNNNNNNLWSNLDENKENVDNSDNSDSSDNGDSSGSNSDNKNDSDIDKIIEIICGCSFLINSATVFGSIHFRDSRPFALAPSKIRSMMLAALSGPSAEIKTERI